MSDITVLELPKTLEAKLRELNYQVVGDVAHMDSDRLPAGIGKKSLERIRQALRQRSIPRLR